MRHALAALTALTLCLPAIAHAQRFDRESGGQQEAPQAGPQGRDGGFFGRATPNQAAPPLGPQLAQDRDRRDADQDRRDRERRDADRDRRDGDRDRRDVERGRDFRDDRDRGGPRRSFSYLGRQYSAVRAPEFRYPRGWSYRHWSRGDLLPRLFLADAFFIDYGYLGLPPPPRNYRWVRYGPDALLVNVYDGRVIDAIYDAFY